MSMRFRLAVVVYCLGTNIHAASHIKDLATTDAGSVVYFSTTLQQKGAPLEALYKVLLFDSGSLTTVAKHDFSQTSPFLESILPDVTGDGAKIAYNAQSDCYLQNCGVFSYSERFHGTVVDRSGVTLYSREGKVSLSRDGRYVVFNPGHDFAPVLDPLVRIDTQTGQETSTPAFEHYDSIRTAIVTSNGLVIFARSTILKTFDGITVKEYTIKDDSYRIASDDLGRTIAFDTAGAGTGMSKIFLFDLARGTASELVSAAEGAWSPSVSRDGRALLFLSPANFSGRNNAKHVQAFLVRPAGSGLRQLTRPGDDVASAILSGNGAVAFASTESNAVLRIDVNTGAVTELIPPTPSFDERSLAAVPGSLMRVTGDSMSTAEASAKSFPLPTDLGGIRVLVDGVAAPLISVKPSEILLQIPSQTKITGIPANGEQYNFAPPFGTLSLKVERTTDSTLEGLTSILSTISTSPRFYDASAPIPDMKYPRDPCRHCLPLAVHQDFNSLVNSDAPARLGEIIHLYFSGLGPVQPSVSDGQAAAAAPLSNTERPLECGLADDPLAPSLVVNFAGLAPGQVGVYQVDITIPQGFNKKVLQLHCVGTGIADIPVQ